MYTRNSSVTTGKKQNKTKHQITQVLHPVFLNRNSVISCIFKSVHTMLRLTECFVFRQFTAEKLYNMDHLWKFCVGTMTWDNEWGHRMSQLRHIWPCRLIIPWDLFCKPVEHQELALIRCTVPDHHLAGTMTVSWHECHQGNPVDMRCLMSAWKEKIHWRGSRFSFFPGDTGRKPTKT